jgi:uncharacterized membrane protein
MEKKFEVIITAEHCKFSIPLYSTIIKYVASISIFYLLLNVNLTSIKRIGLPMICLLLISSFRAALGSSLKFLVV